jgi:hypothetical protein
MATTVSLVTINTEDTPISITIHGTGLVDPNLKIIHPSGQVLTYDIIIDTPRMAKINNINPPFENGRYRIMFLNRELFVIDLATPKIDLSGLYFINPSKTTRRDTYYTAEYKIPDPTIRTALIGE